MWESWRLIPLSFHKEYMFEITHFLWACCHKHRMTFQLVSCENPEIQFVDFH